MLLQPRTFKHKRIHKRRSIIKCKKNSNLSFGTSGLVILRPLQLSSTQLQRFKLFLKRAMRKTDKTKRFFWFNSFPHLPLTRKSTGSRMGKGKGKLKKWFIQLRGNTVLFEFINLRYGRSLFFIKQMTHKLYVPTRAIFLNNCFLNLPFLKTKRVFVNLLK